MTGCQRSADENVVATFENGSLTIEDLEAHRQILSRQDAYRENPERLTQEFVFEHAVNMEMIIAKGLKENLHLDPNIRARIHEFMSDLFLKIMQDKLVPKIDREDFTEEEVRSYFEDNIESYQIPPQYGVRMIRHDDSDFLEELRREINAEEKTFEDTALEFSMDEKTRQKGGYTGMRPLDRYRPDWRAAIEPLDVNEVSDTVSIKGDYYLFQVVEKTDPQTPDFEEKKAYVRNDLLYARYREAWRRTYDALKQE
ncbi:MAG: peptidylprolyl isomerase, partial [Desulfosalsimonas sp.]